MLGMLNARPIPNNPLGATRTKNPAAATAATRRGGPTPRNTTAAIPPAYVTPPMYKPPLAPIAVPGMNPATTYHPIPPPPAATAATNKLEQWRKDRAQRMNNNNNNGNATPAPAPATPEPIVHAAVAAPVTPVTPAATPVVDLNKLREELMTLVQTQAPKLDLDLKLLPFNQRLQDLDVRLNSTKVMLEEMNLSLNAIQLQSGQDRRLLLNGITADDFKGLHEDLSAALHDYFVEFEDTLQNLLQEFNDRIYCVYAVTTLETPQLQGPSFLEAVPDLPKIPPGTRVKVCYPQHQTAEGIFIRHLAVNPHTGQITLNWIPLQTTQQTYLGQFSV